MQNLIFEFINAGIGDYGLTGAPVQTTNLLGVSSVGTFSDGVTSVGLSVPSSLLTVGGSPVTQEGTISIGLSSQSPFTVFARGSGNGTPSFQSLSQDHIPQLSLSKIQEISPGLLGRISSVGGIQQLTDENVRDFLNVEDGANNYVHPSFITENQSLSGATVLQGVNIVNGHISSLSTRQLLSSDIGAVSQSHVVAPGFGINVSGGLSGASTGISINTSQLDTRYLRKDDDDSSSFDYQFNRLSLSELLVTSPEVDLTNIALDESSESTNILGLSASGRLLRMDIPSFGFNVQNGSGDSQFSIDSGDGIRFSGSGDTSVSFNPSTKTVTITSTQGSGEGGAVTSFNGRDGAVTSQSGDYNTSLVTEDPSALYFTQPRVRSTPLSGISIVNSIITSSDNVLSALGKAQGQINSLVPNSRILTVSGVSGRTSVSGGSQNLASNRSWVVDLATVGSPGSYNNVTVDGYGRVVSGSNASYLTGNQNITLSGDVTGSGSTSISSTISNGAVSYAKIQNVTGNRILGRAGSNGVVQELTASTARSILGTDDRYVRFDSSSQGLTSAQQSNARTNINAQVAGNYSLVGHTHSIGDIVNLQSELDNRPLSGTGSSQVRTNSQLDARYVQLTDSRLTNSREWSASTVTQAEAEAGTSTTRRAWTSQRVRQNVVSYASPLSRIIATGDGLSGGGNLSANRTISVDSTVVRTSGTQSIAGEKRFTNSVNKFNTTSNLSGGGAVQVNGNVNCDSPSQQRHAVTLGFLEGYVAANSARNNRPGSYAEDSTVTLSAFSVIGNSLALGDQYIISSDFTIRSIIRFRAFVRFSAIASNSVVGVGMRYQGNDQRLLYQHGTGQHQMRFQLESDVVILSATMIRVAMVLHVHNVTTGETSVIIGEPFNTTISNYFSSNVPLQVSVSYNGSFLSGHTASLGMVTASHSVQTSFSDNVMN